MSGLCFSRVSGDAIDKLISLIHTILAEARRGRVFYVYPKAKRTDTGLKTWAICESRQLHTVSFVIV